MDAVTICNMALLAFGAKPITSIADGSIDSDEAQLCATYYDASLRTCLESVAPLFATDLINLGARQDSPYKSLSLGGLLGPGSPFMPKPLIAMFAIPTTVIRPLVCDDGSGQFTISWEPHGQNIYCEDTTQLYCKVIQYIDDPNKWNPSFMWAVAYKLASVICGTITHSSAVKKEMIEELKMAMDEARQLDGMRGSVNRRVRAVSTSLANRRT